ncbi:hypothetical protein G9A89_007968 [Geosiphon pyriformis]|nr:hypothetical protein G9A89_007968 [Geosiphon pyriformis]
MQKNTIYIQIPDTLLPQWRRVHDKLRLKKEIEISTDGSLVKAGSEDIKRAATFVTHRIEANFGIAVDGTLSSTKTEAKAVLLALEAVPYKCKLILNTDSQAVVSTAQKWLSHAVIGEKGIEFNINKVAVHTGIAENKMADKLAKEATAFDITFSDQQTGIQGVLEWIGNNKVQEMVGSLDQGVDWKCTTKVWNWDGKMSSDFTSAGFLAMHTFIMKSFHNMLPTAEVLYNRHFLVYLNNLCKTCHTEVETNQHFWKCSLRNEWMQCLLKAVKRKHKILDPGKKVFLSNKYIWSMPNIDFLCKGLINKQFGRINAFSDIDQRTNNNILIKVLITESREAYHKKIDKPSTKPMTNVHGDKKKGLGIAKAIPVHINVISIETDMEVSEAKEYTIIVGNKWLKKAKALLDYKLCELTIRCDEKPIVIKCCHWTTSPVPKQNQKEEQSDESNDNESNEEEDQEEQKKTAELPYTIFTSNSKPLDNIKADKEEIMVNGKLICWPYYDILRRTFDKKPGKKAKYSYWWHGSYARCWCNKPLYSPSDKCKFCLIYYKNWEPISLIPKEELKEVQKFFENKPPEIQSLVVKQKEPFPKKNEVEMDPESRKKTAFITKYGTYEFTVMFFGLTNAPHTFQCPMDKEKLVTEPILKQPDLDQSFILYTDISGYELGAVLL